MVDKLSLPQRRILAKWEEPIPKEKFSSYIKSNDNFSFRETVQFPLRRVTRDELSQRMGFNQILDTTNYIADNNLRRKQKWRELRVVYSLINNEKYRKGSIDFALWALSGSNVTSRLFVTAVMSEFKFDNTLNADSHLLALYLSFDNGAKDSADWRDILASIHILKYFRMIKLKSDELILLLFNIYTVGESRSAQSCNPEGYVLDDASQIVTRIFDFPCESESEAQLMRTMLVDLLEAIHDDYKDKITRAEFRKLLPKYGENAVMLFAKYAWIRVPAELRLIHLDETQQFHIDNAEFLLLKHKINQAIKFNNLNICRIVYREWKMEMLRESGVRRHIHYRKVIWRHRFFKFWLELTRVKDVRRQRRMLAKGLGKYAKLARIFARMKLFAFEEKRLRLIGLLDKRAKMGRLAISFINEALRLQNMRLFYHRGNVLLVCIGNRWWNKCVALINHEVALAYDRKRALLFCFRPWGHYATDKAHQKRMEALSLENQIMFQRRMAAVDEAAQELVRLNKAKAEQKQLQELKLQEELKEKRIAEAKRKMQAEKEADRKHIHSVQRDQRRKRVKKELKKMKKDFDKIWEEKTAKAMQRAKDKIHVFLTNPENKIAIDIRFEKLKANFEMAPSKETAAREKALSSLANIVLLFVQAKLNEDFLEIKEILAEFDTGKKGYLTYDEFVEMVRSTGTKLSKPQIMGCIRSIDADGDGTIDIPELHAAMEETAIMGVPGSPWKMYIDPAEDVLCYHNFQTGEKIFDYQMKDKKLREISIADMYGEADDIAAADIRREREADWHLTYRSYMAKRIQYMYRVRKARKSREQKVWKIRRKMDKIRTHTHRKCVRFIEKCFMGYKSREIFQKQLFFIFEKMYHIESKKIFWFNHHTKEAKWEKPFVLRRYGDVTEPVPWVPVDVTVEASATQEQRMIAYHYYHIPSKKDIPRKPDGYPICQQCFRNLARHFCVDCSLNYCVGCHRHTHANPFGVRQKAKATQKEFSDHEFLLRLHNCGHKWTPSKLLQCQLCFSKSILAGVHCNQCVKDLCRPCSRRVHGMENKLIHDFYDI